MGDNRNSVVIGIGMGQPASPGGKAWRHGAMAGEPSQQQPRAELPRPTRAAIEFLATRDCEDATTRVAGSAQTPRLEWSGAESRLVGGWERCPPCRVEGKGLPHAAFHEFSW